MYRYCTFSYFSNAKVEDVRPESKILVGGRGKDWPHFISVPYMGGVNLCSLHCPLAKFRGLMIKYSAVIGRETRFFVCAQLQFGWI